MKKQLFPTAILRSFLILASLVLMITFSLQPSFSKDCTTVKTVFYKGEWIMRVDLPEVNIAATRILKGGIAPLLKHVSSSDPERKGELVILTEDININASNPSELVKETAIINDNNNESTFTIEVVMIEGEKASQIQLLVSKNEDGKQQLSSMATGTFGNTKNDISFKKKPLFNRLLNTMIDAGIHFLQKVNEGLFFKS